MSEHSDALVFFGATGDLAYKKIFPALQAMVKRGHLDAPVIGVAKSAFRTATHAVPVIRGTSERPLYVTAAGMPRADAADLVRRGIPTAMYGPADWNTTANEGIPIADLVTASKVYAAACVDLITRRPTFVPLNCVVAPYNPVSAMPLFYTSTNGLASGNTRLEALCHALCEVIERDATALAMANPSMCEGAPK